MYLNKVRTFQNYEKNKSHTPPFLLLKKYPENAKFSDFFSLKEVSVATFSIACALTSRKHITIPNLLGKLIFFWSHCSVCALEK